MVIPGEITEIVGRRSSGRTSALLACPAGVTRAGGRGSRAPGHALGGRAAAAGAPGRRASGAQGAAVAARPPRGPGVVGASRVRVACVWVPHFAAAAALRAEPELRHRPVAIVEG